MEKVRYSETSNYDFLLDLSKTRDGKVVTGLMSEGVITSLSINRNMENKITSVYVKVISKPMLETILSTGEKLETALADLKEHTIKVAGTMAPLEELTDLDNSGYDIEKQAKFIQFEDLKGEAMLAVSANNKPYIRQVNIVATNYKISEYQVKEK